MQESPMESSRVLLQQLHRLVHAELEAKYLCEVNDSPLYQSDIPLLQKT